jgi:predicted Zn-dependent protease
MATNLVDRLNALLEQGHETAVLRFSLGNACLVADPAQAVRHLRRAIELDPEYSAAWKVLARALEASGDTAAAISAFASGIAIAERRGDIQAAREMRVFLKRIGKRVNLKVD